MNVPIQISSSLASAQNFLGLAKNSTVLNRLSWAGLIASRAWGYYQGWTGAETEHQRDGSLVLGGYDKAKTIGENTTFPIFDENRNCTSGLAFSVADIKMNFLNGTDVSILGPSPGAAINACLTTISPLISLPVDIFDSFVQFSEMNVLGQSYGINDPVLISGSSS